MSGGKKPRQKGRDVDRSDSGYTTQADMDTELNAPSHGRLAGAGDPSMFGPPRQRSAKPTTAPININSGRDDSGTGALSGSS